jgi:hypothetical protein
MKKKGHTKECEMLAEKCDEEGCRAIICQNPYCDYFDCEIQGKHNHKKVKE